jgi:hypothetical protein
MLVPVVWMDLSRAGAPWHRAVEPVLQDGGELEGRRRHVRAGQEASWCVGPWPLGSDRERVDVFDGVPFGLTFVMGESPDFKPFAPRLPGTGWGIG